MCLTWKDFESLDGVEREGEREKEGSAQQQKMVQCNMNRQRLRSLLLQMQN